LQAIYLALATSTLVFRFRARAKRKQYSCKQNVRSKNLNLRMRDRTNVFFIARNDNSVEIAACRRHARDDRNDASSVQRPIVRRHPTARTTRARWSGPSKIIAGCCLCGGCFVIYAFRPFERSIEAKMALVRIVECAGIDAISHYMTRAVVGTTMS
jgi:hypothetical protein